jgi:hypothetical protein
MSKKKMTFGQVLREGRYKHRLKRDMIEVPQHDYSQFITIVTHTLRHSLRSQA